MASKVVILAAELLLFFAVSVSSRGFYRDAIPDPIPLPSNVPPEVYGDPLFLTPYIEAGQIDKARNLSQVGKLPNSPPLTSYSGFFTVNKQLGSNMFFWFFPALNKNPKAPVILWLQGGPGGSSLFGLFVENGPYIINSDLSASLRKYTWAQTFSVLYIDNPVGTGFSFTQSKDGYARNETQVARDLYEALQQFFTVFYEHRGNDFYVTGESYAGKYVPAIAYKIHTEGRAAKINLKGIAIGDGLCDPETMMGFGDYLYQVGLIDRVQAAYFNQQRDLIVDNIQKKKWVEAKVLLDKLILGDGKNPSYFTNTTGFTFHYNYLVTSSPKEFQYYNSFIILPDVRKAVHVGNLTFNDESAVEQALTVDFMQSVKPWVVTLLENYKVLIYNGQLDIIVAYPLTVNFLQSLNWKYADDYKNAPRQIWKVSPTDQEVAGYVHQVKDFYEVIVRNAGHIVPHDQPRVAFDMINRFIRGKPFNR
uniref:Carboxypeptidase n=1 Tax=Liphistius sp. SGP-2016 TaxID=1905180 RepID=A0A4Q8K3H4_9ARAC